MGHCIGWHTETPSWNTIQRQYTTDTLYVLPVLHAISTITAPHFYYYTPFPLLLHPTSTTTRHFHYYYIPLPLLYAISTITTPHFYYYTPFPLLFHSTSIILLHSTSTTTRHFYFYHIPGTIHKLYKEMLAICQLVICSVYCLHYLQPDHEELREPIKMQFGDQLQG